MPGWHEITAPLESEGKLKVLGIAEEQHADRTRLFMQWKQMDWPVLADPFNLLGVSSVPITLFVDEHGIVRSRNPKRDELADFIEATFDPPEAEAIEVRPPLSANVLGQLPRCIDSHLTARRREEAKAEGEATPLSADAHFRRGVLHRMRWDSDFRHPDDFAKAVEHWSEALRMNPNQYIWRRRVQQYGPRLDKPYSFYDWVREAREEIAARGDTPMVLVAEPSGAEFAHPAREDGGGAAGEAGDASVAHPDPEGRLDRDTGGLISVSPVIVPSTAGDARGFRVHLTFTPDEERHAHWNNESGEARFFLESGSSVVLPVPEDPPATSTEPRTVEFEIAPEEAPSGEIRGTLFFFVCEGAEGVCRYLARDVEVSIPGASD